MKRFIIRYGWEALLSTMAFFALSAAFRFQGLVALFGGLSHHLVILLLAIILGKAMSLVAIRKEIGILLDQHRRTADRLRRPLSLYFQTCLSELQHIRGGLSGDGGKELTLEELERFVGACFTANRGRSYIGTDSSVPTEFYRLYPTYLDSHFGALPSGIQRRDARILFRSESDLQNDFQSNKAIFRTFYEAHILYHVRLLQVEKNTATALAQLQRLPSTDVGIFGREFVVFFSPQLRKGTPVKYRIHVRPLDPGLRRQLREYMRILNGATKEVYLQNERLSCVQRDSQTVQDDERRLLRGLQE